MIRFPISVLFLHAAVSLSMPAWAAGRNAKMEMPDFTQGDVIPANAKHDWNLGATGLRGWMYCDMLMTTDARQIMVTEVKKGSPADGNFVVGDVILGVAGKAFSIEPRSEFGQAISHAESTAGGGKLAITRWRDGKTDEVEINMPVMGNYSATAPYNCEKSQKILAQGCKVLAQQMESAPPHIDPIVRSVNALALLASGEKSYLPLLKKEARWAASFTSDGYKTWYYGYAMLFLSEYVIATGDKSVMSGLRRLALEAAKSQSAVGSWGHKFAKPDGRLFGYGMMNSPGIPLTISLVLARQAGVRDPEVTKAIELSAKLLRFYIGKGAVPYGDHDAWMENHDDNGKCGMASVLFHLLGEAQGAEFFSRMSVACYGAERDTGHTGNYFNMLWAMPGVAQSGSQATGLWMKEFGGWYYDLARQVDGTFVHQGPPEPGFDSYRGWDCTGAFLLAYAMPLKKIHITGKLPSKAPQVTAEQAQSLINDGRGWSNKHRHRSYDLLTDAELIQALSSWSPIVRERAAIALSRRKDAPINDLLKLLQGETMNGQLGACQALAMMGQRGAPAVDLLIKLLDHKDMWLRIKAAEALTAIGDPAKKALPRLLALMLETDEKYDPRGMQQRYLCTCLFSKRGSFVRDVADADRKALYNAVRMGLQNQDGRARSSISTLYESMSLEELKPLFPAIMEAVMKPAPSGEMFADQIRVEGIRVMAKHKIREGIPACVTYIREQNPWASEKRTEELMQILLTYGNQSKPFIPQLKKIADYFEKDEPDFPQHLMILKAKYVRDTIAAIEQSTESPRLIPMK